MIALKNDHAARDEAFARLTVQRYAVFRKPLCPQHGVPMAAYCTINGVTYYQCPRDNCKQSWKGRVEGILEASEAQRLTWKSRQENS